MKIKENINNVEEFMELFDAVGWGSHDYEISKRMLENNIYSVSIYDNDKIIAYGRIIGDGISYLYIHDVMVIPSYQGKHIGTMIMKELLKKIDEIYQINPNLRVYLGASKNKEDFYRKFGFVTRAEKDLGAGMILNRN